MTKRVWIPGLLVFGAVLSGCAARVGIVAYGPPPPRYGVVGYAPGPGYVWTEGYWGWRGGAYAWVPGRWMRPPHPRAEWVPGRWERRHERWAFRRGYWR